MTTYHGPQPDFWLEIRKEYIIENFEKLLIYIRKYQYTGNRESGAGEFLTTCRYLTDLANDFSENSTTSSFTSLPEFRLSTTGATVEPNLAFRVMVAAILASKKIGRDEHKLIDRLVNLLVVYRKMPQTDIADGLMEVVANCVRKTPILSMGMKWDDIENPYTFSPNRLLHNICQTRFDIMADADDRYFEGKGTVKFGKDRITAAPVNCADFNKETMSDYIPVGHGLMIQTPKSDRMKQPETVEDIGNGAVYMTRAQGGVKPSPVETKKKYSAGALLTVVITSSWGVKIEASTIDSDFTRIQGKVNINLVEALRYADIFAILPCLIPGTLLLVAYTPDDPEFTFTLRPGFDQFYKAFAEDMRAEDLTGVYLSDYSAGTQWLTNEGFVVNVMGPITNDDMLFAKEQHIPLTVRINNTRELKGTVLVNGNIIDDLDECELGEPIVDMDSHQKECFKYLFEEYIGFCRSLAPEKRDGNEIRMTSAEAVITLSNILVEHQRRLSSTIERLGCLQSALMLAITAGDYTLGAYVRHELEYQLGIARFAGGASPMSISLSHGPNLDGIPEIEKHERIIEMIRNYREPEIGRASDRQTTDENLEDTVDGLIDASNRLIGKIDDREIARIKLELARALDVDDQYKAYDEGTYFGVESDILEFKSSAVCPPKNRLKGTAEYEPETQKWAILKTVCGFLNSVTGGDLLIGVRDNGLACGIEKDYQLLYEDRRIPEATADRYRTYLKNIIDNAFMAYKSRAEKSSITTTNVTYTIEKTAEGIEILRIHVDSYRGDMVKFHSAVPLPEEIQEAYIRTSGATVPMNREIRNQTMLRKYHLAGDREGIGMAAIYEARNSKKRVLLKEYTSVNGIKDREVEVFHVFPESRCILAYDTAIRDVRLFKTTRWKDAKILDKNCTQGSSSKRDLQPDIFGNVYDPNKTSYKVDIYLSHYGAVLMREEHPAAEAAMSATGKKDFPWLMTTYVNNLEGPARFVRGLPNDSKAADGSELADYLL